MALASRRFRTFNHEANLCIGTKIVNIGLAVDRAMRPANRVSRPRGRCGWKERRFYGFSEPKRCSDLAVCPILLFSQFLPSGLTLLVPPEILANINTLVFLDSLVTDIAGIAFHLLEKGLLIVRSL